MRVKEKVPGFGFSLGGGFGVAFGGWFWCCFCFVRGIIIAGLLSALECAGCGARCMLVSDRDERALLSEDRSRRAEAKVAVAGTRVGNELSKTVVLRVTGSIELSKSAPANPLHSASRMRSQCGTTPLPERVDSSVRFATGGAAVRPAYGRPRPRLVFCCVGRRPRPVSVPSGAALNPVQTSGHIVRPLHQETAQINVPRLADVVLGSESPDWLCPGRQPRNAPTDRLCATASTPSRVSA